jgi:bacterioferritin (cytochrome b1)
MAVKKQSGDSKLLALLNRALGWELRAQALYAHYAAYVKGLESLTLAGHFEAEAAESVAHAKQVRDVIAMLDGVAVTVRDPAPIVHTDDTRVMLKESLKTEAAAAAVYRTIVPLVKDNSIFFHSLSHILMDEMKAVVELENLLAR